MSPEEFVRAVWPDTGLYAVAIPFTPPGSPRAVFKHQVFSSKSAALSTALALASQHDVYFCVNSLRERRVWNASKPNRKTGAVGAWEVRTHQNICAARSLFLDIDVGSDGHKYPTQVDALRALREFIQATGLPTPTIVSSGYGLHVYWPLDQDVTPDQWRALAGKLKAATVAKGLKVDQSRTTDMASVLRLPGTLNHKREPRAVQVIKAGQPTSVYTLQ
jgi:DNA primase